MYTNINIYRAYIGMCCAVYVNVVMPLWHARGSVAGGCVGVAVLQIAKGRCVHYICMFIHANLCL